MNRPHPQKFLNSPGVHSMSKLAIVYHSAHGHTEFIAELTAAGLWCFLIQAYRLCWETPRRAATSATG